MVMIRKRHDETDKVEVLTFEDMRSAARCIAEAKKYGVDEASIDEVEETLKDLGDEYDDEHTYTVFDERKEVAPPSTPKTKYVMLVPNHWSSGNTIAEAFENMQDEVRSNTKLAKYLSETDSIVLMKLPENWTKFWVTEFGSVGWNVPEGEPVGKCERYTFRFGVGWVRDERS